MCISRKYGVGCPENLVKNLGGEDFLYSTPIREYYFTYISVALIQPFNSEIKLWAKKETCKMAVITMRLLRK